MKKVSIFCLFFFLLFLTSCSTSNVKVSYDNTNPVKIEEATKGLNLLEILPDPSEVKGTIAVKSIEIDIDDQLDESVLYMIEDNLISSLIDNNYRVVERDPDALTSLYRESSSKYKRKKESNSDNQSYDVSELGNLTLNSSGESVINFTISEDGEDIKDDNSKDEKNLIDTNLNSADYILSYRVIECGVIYSETNAVQEGLPIPDFAKLDNIERSAKTRLHCRLTNAKTSEIVAAGLIENEVVDIIDRDDINSLKKISYSYYHHTLPLQTLEAYKDKETMDVVKNIERKEKFRKFRVGLVGTFLSVLGLFIISN